jgi:hypothetical protein
MMFRVYLEVATFQYTTTTAWVSSRNDTIGHTRHHGDMDTVTGIGNSFTHGVGKNHAAGLFVRQGMNETHALGSLKIQGQFAIVRGKQRHASAVCVKMLQDRLRQGRAFQR